MLFTQSCLLLDYLSYWPVWHHGDLMFLTLTPKSQPWSLFPFKNILCNCLYVLNHLVCVDLSGGWEWWMTVFDPSSNRKPIGWNSIPDHLASLISFFVCTPLKFLEWSWVGGDVKGADTCTKWPVRNGKLSPAKLRICAFWVHHPFCQL
jgi:hypothetical protein